MNKKDIMRSVIVFCLLIGFIACADTLKKADLDYRIGRIKSSIICESSGIVPSSKHSGVFWVHNDSGDFPVLYAITLDGKHLGAYEVRGAQAKDWEDITSDGKGALYVGDIGNNSRERNNLVIYKINEPEEIERKGTLKVVETIPLKYPGKNYDCEALCFSPNGNLMLITKNPKPATIYELVNGMWIRKQILNIPNVATGAEVNEQGQLVLSTYIGYHIFTFDKTTGKWREKQLVIAPVEQCEAACWDDQGNIIMTSEQRSIFRFNPKMYKAREKAFEQPTWSVVGDETYIPVKDGQNVSNKLKFKFRSSKNGNVFLDFFYPDNAENGDAVFYFSKEKPGYLLTCSPGDLRVKMMLKKGSVYTSVKYLKFPESAAPLPVVRATRVKPGLISLTLPKEFINQQNAFAAYFVGWKDKKKGWPFSFYRIHDQHPFFWAERK